MVQLSVTAELSQSVQDGRWPELASPQLPGMPTDVDSDRLVATLMQRCPGSLVWFGKRTRRWWAFVKLRGMWTLIDRETVQEIARTLMPMVPADVRIQAIAEIEKDNSLS